MQDFRDNEKKTIKNYRQLAILDFFLRNLSWVILVWVLKHCSICMVQLFCFVFELRKYHKNFLKSKWLNGHFKIVCSQKLIRSLADIAVHIRQKKGDLLETFSWNALKSIYLLVALVIKLYGIQNGTKNYSVVCDVCKISEIMRKKTEMADWRPFWILLVRNLSWIIIVWDLPFCFIFIVQLFCIFCVT